MQEDIFSIMQDTYQKGVFTVPTTFYFSVGDIKRTNESPRRKQRGIYRL